MKNTIRIIRTNNNCARVAAMKDMVGQFPRIYTNQMFDKEFKILRKLVNEHYQIAPQSRVKIYVLTPLTAKPFVA